MGFIGTIWNEVIVRPFINILVLIYSLLGHNFFFALVIFTILVTVVFLPITLKQLHSTKKMMALQPKLKEIQLKYAKDKQKISQETFKLYREAGVNPISCLGPLFIQMPVWIGLYSAITQVLPTQPEELVKLSQSLYSWLPLVHTAVPIKGTFLWLDLGFSDTGVIPILPIIVAASTWGLQKMTAMPNTNAQQQQQNQMFLWMMPVMFGFIALTSPSGLAIFWTVSNIIRMIIQYFVTGWGGLATMFQKRTPVPAVIDAKNDNRAIMPPPSKETSKDGQDRDISKDSGGSDRIGSQGTRRQERRGRDRGNNKGQGGNTGNRR
ncbi:MAG: membrane protein insertase YidC [Dehalococcoidia bacterium]|nr:membrane protein insertase YidC [Dehalococcoidia bacterium]